MASKAAGPTTLLGDRKSVYKTMFPAPDAFTVYEKISKKNRYVPRQWTQKEFETALRDRHDKETICFSSNKCGSTLKSNNGKESDTKTIADELFLTSENVENIPPTQLYVPKRSKSHENVNNLKESLSASQNEDSLSQLPSTNTVNELENSKNSEATVKMASDQFGKEDATVKWQTNECEATVKPNRVVISFLEACLQCLFNINTFKDKVLLTLKKGTYSSFESELKYLLEAMSLSDKPNNFWRLHSQDVFSALLEKITVRGESCDRALVLLLESLVEELDYYDAKTGKSLRSIIQGKFCHARLCEHCDTVVKEHEPFMFLNPSMAPAIALTNPRELNVNFVSLADWSVTSHPVSVSSGDLVGDLKEELIKYLPENLESSSIKICEVQDNCLMEVFDETRNLQDIYLEAGSSLFALHVIRCQSEVKRTLQDGDVEVNVSSQFADMTYNLYFSCGLCLNDGKDRGLLVHRSCGGMVCKDCLDEITRSSQNWELCQCPVCERPVDIATEMCPARTSAETDQLDVTCVVLLRTNGPNTEHSELFGVPLLVSLPKKTSGYHLYRGISCLLPKKLPMKDKTSFTLHKVNKTGLQCGSCSLPDCTGCLVRINDTINIRPHIRLVVHFDNLTEKSREYFGAVRCRTGNTSKMQQLFDDILRSCADASSPVDELCPKCFNVMGQTISSISNFPELLIIHLNRNFAKQGLPHNIPIANVARFVTVERENLSKHNTIQNLTYQLSAAVLREASTVYPTYKSYVTEKQASNWLARDDELEASEDLNFHYLTCDAVLFYEPVLQQFKSSRQLQTTKDDDDTIYYQEWSVDKGDRSPRYSINLDQPADNHMTRYLLKKSKADEIETNDQYVSKPWDREPGECVLRNDMDEEIRFQGANDVHSSRVSLGELKASLETKQMTADVFDGIDTISPISTTDVRHEPQVLRETKKLINAVKLEDAYGIVCCLKRGADPCLLVNDVTTLHLVAGIKSDQRCSMLAYLLKYSDDVNIATADGTTPMHVAAAWGHLDVVELLLRHGGDAFERTDIEGKCAFDLAVKDCSTYLQSVYNGTQHSTRFLEFSDSNKPTSSHSMTHSDESKEKRLEDIVRSNVTLPSFVEEHGSHHSQISRRWLKRLQTFRERSTEILRNLRRMGDMRRRSRIGVMVT